MAKGNMLLGQARGKVGSLVFSRLNGQQVTRAKAEKVSNPRTESQNTQRAIFATVAKAAQALGPIVDHSFQSVKYGSDSLNYFRKQNLSILRSAYLAGKNTDLLTKGADSVTPNEYLISQGSLPSVLIAQATFSGAAAAGIEFELPNLMPVASVANANSPLVTLSMLQNLYGIQAGDQLTIVAIANKLDYEDTPEGFGRVVYGRVVLLPDLDPSAAVIGKDGFIATSIDPNASTNTAWLKTRNGSTQGDRNRLYIDPTAGGLLTLDVEEIQAVGIIVSRYDELSAKWLRSSSRMVLSASVAAANPDGDQSAIDSYGNTASNVNSDEYLNQADESATANQTQDIARGNYIVTVYNSEGVVVGEGKFAQGAANPTIDVSPSVLAAKRVSVKATTFKGVTVEELVLSDVGGTGLDTQGIVSSARKQATVSAIVSPEGDIQTYEVSLIATTMFEHGNVETSRTNFSLETP